MRLLFDDIYFGPNQWLLKVPYFFYFIFNIKGQYNCQNDIKMPSKFLKIMGVCMMVNVMIPIPKMCIGLPSNGTLLIADGVWGVLTYFCV